MARKFLACAFGLFLTLPAVQVWAHPAPQQSQPQQQAQQAKEVSGTVTAIGSDHRSFAMEVKNGDNTNAMQFVIDNNTQVQGRVGVGSTATVEYQPNDDGKNLALNIAPQSSQNQQNPQ